MSDKPCEKCKTLFDKQAMLVAKLIWAMTAVMLTLCWSFYHVGTLR